MVTLLDGPLHGHGIIKRAEEISGGRVRLAAGTLHAALDRLTREGLVEALHEETVNGRVRRYYALTVSGIVAGSAVALLCARYRLGFALALLTPLPSIVPPFRNTWDNLYVFQLVVSLSVLVLVVPVFFILGSALLATGALRARHRVPA